MTNAQIARRYDWGSRREIDEGLQEYESRRTDEIDKAMLTLNGFYSVEPKEELSEKLVVQSFGRFDSTLGAVAVIV